MSQTTLAESLLLNRDEYLDQAVLLRATYRLKEIAPAAVFFCRWVPKGEGPQQQRGATPDSDPEVWRSWLTESAGTRRPRKLASEVVFCFAALRSDVFSP